MDNKKLGKLTLYTVQSLCQELDVSDLRKQENEELVKCNKIFDEYILELEKLENKIINNVVILPEKFNKKKDKDIGKYGVSLGSMKEFNKMFISDLRKNFWSLKINKIKC